MAALLADWEVRESAWEALLPTDLDLGFLLFRYRLLWQMSLAQVVQLCDVALYGGLGRDHCCVQSHALASVTLEASSK